MARRLFPAAGLLAALLGCGKGGVPGLGGGGDGDTSAGDPNAAYTLKLRDKHAGDRFDVTETLTTSTRTTEHPGDKKKPTERGQTSRYEFTEVVEETKDGHPTRVKRAYRVAETTKDGEPQPATLAGKTITVQHQKGGLFTFRTEQGVEVVGPDRLHLQLDFGGGGRDRMSVMLPDQSIKVSETFVLDRARLERLLGPSTDGFGTATGDGKLTRAYTKDGKQYGVIELGVSVATPTAGGQPESSMSTTVVYNGCVDGTVLDGEVVITQTVNLVTRDPRTGVVRKQQTETARTITARPAAN